ncbi:hypothetical protein ACFFNY_25940 [Paenibacillus hodogayensis]|uniref:Copper amine oxidase n=1 Tax=Paenibacillus hodogayensis TaxID=279208 RepID=A0ABV5W478_9BACL
MRETMKKRLAVLMGAAVLTASGGALLPAKAAWAETVSVTAADETTGASVTADESTGTTADETTGTSANAEESTGSSPAADESTGPSAAAEQTKQVSYIDILASRNLSSYVAQAAALGDQDFDTVWQEVLTGKSLSEASGVPAGDLEAALLQSLAQSLSADVENGALTAGEAEQTKASAIATIRAVIAGASTSASVQAALIGGADIVQSRLDRVIEDTAALLELNARELRQSLRDGRSLAEASGQDAATLAAQLAGMLNQDLDASVQAGQLARADADTRKREGLEALGRIVAEAGYDRETTPWMEQYGNALLASQLGFAVNYAYALSSREYDDFYSDLAEGASIETASGLTEKDLLPSISAMIGNAVDEAWLNGKLSAGYADELKLQADEQLKTALTAPGYGQSKAVAIADDAAVAASAQDYAEGRLSQVAADVAAWAGTRADVLLEKLAQGQTLAQAAGTDSDALLRALVKSVAVQLNAYAADGTFTEKDVASAKSSYTAGLVQLLNNA